jgi:hypothetical protein
LDALPTPRTHAGRCCASRRGFDIRFTPEAERHLAFLSARDRRIGGLRVYFDTEALPNPAVVVVATGVKLRERLRFGGEEVDLG